ncbi:MAG: LysR substrate-binding domain-containing protein [Actinomycetota bacterium]|nr:LysR substrate-binding domain-containing protein [Actinomycetota bacterium]
MNDPGVRSPRTAPPLPSLEALRLFVLVSRLGSVSRAAAAAGLAQPSVSARLAGLERQLGVKLLERGATGSVPTEDGAVVAEWAQRVLEAAEHLTAGVSALRRERTGRLRLAASFTIAEHLLPRWLSKFQRSVPSVRTELEVANSTRVVDRVRDGFDLGFVEAPELPGDMAYKVVGSDDLVVVVPPGHAWTRRRAPLSVAALVATPLVVREPDSGTREALDRALDVVGAPSLKARLELGSSSSVVAAVAGGAGPGVLSRLAVADQLASGALCPIEVAGLDMSRRLHALWPASRALAPAAAALLAQLPGVKGVVDRQHSSAP